jgi:broad specificity phosphatase PhoE
MSTLILLRHGQAAFGAERYDALSDLGRQQAERAGLYLAGRGSAYDRVWIGPRDRHRLTGRHALEPAALDWQGEAEPMLDEFAEGQQILAAAQQRQGVVLVGPGALRGRQAARHYAQEIEAWAAGISRIPGVPSPADFRASVAAWLDRALASPAAGQRVLVVTSGGVIAALMCQALGLPDAYLSHFMHAIYNASVTEFAFSAGRPISLVSFNVASYLPGPMLTRV